MFRIATPEESSAAALDLAQRIAEWLRENLGVIIYSEEVSDVKDMILSRLGDRIGTQDGEVGE